MSQTRLLDTYPLTESVTNCSNLVEGTGYGWEIKPALKDDNTNCSIQPAPQFTRLPPRSICDNRHPIRPSNHRLSEAYRYSIGSLGHQPFTSPTGHRPLTSSETKSGNRVPLIIRMGILGCWCITRVDLLFKETRKYNIHTMNEEKSSAGGAQRN